MARYASHFERLPGTRVEGERIAAMLGVKALEGGSATKRSVEDARSPAHPAHSDSRLFSAGPAASAGGQRVPDRSGKNRGGRIWPTRCHEVWKTRCCAQDLCWRAPTPGCKGKVLSREVEDGILTAEDASGLDLLFTDLVVLSACQTGLGDIKAGEGVFGLRRAFLLAGAKTLLMSLWKIPDEETQMLMEGFYKRILEGKPRAEALREAQLEVKAVSPEPLFWGAFISQGDPGPLPKN